MPVQGGHYAASMPLLMPHPPATGPSEGRRSGGAPALHPDASHSSLMNSPSLSPLILAGTPLSYGALWQTSAMDLARPRSLLDTLHRESIESMQAPSLPRAFWSEEGRLSSKVALSRPATPLLSARISSACAVSTFQLAERRTASQAATGWILSLLTVLSFAAMAPLGRLVVIPTRDRLVASILLTGWRTALCTVVLLHVVSLLYLQHGLDPDQRTALRSLRMWRGFLECGVYQAVGGIGYSAALTYTTIPQAILSTNLHPVLIIAFRLAGGGYVTLGEWVGVSAAMAGMGLVIWGQVLQPAAELQPHDVTIWDMLLGDVFGIMSSVSFSLVLTRTNRIRQEIPIALFLTLQMGIGTLVTFGAALCFAGADLSTDQWRGLFGFVHPEWVTPVCLGMIVQLFGWFGASTVTAFLHPLLVSTFFTFEPGFAVALGCLLGIEGLPSWVTAAGMAVMVLATVLISGSPPPEEYYPLPPSPLLLPGTKTPFDGGRSFEIDDP